MSQKITHKHDKKIVTSNQDKHKKGKHAKIAEEPLIMWISGHIINRENMNK